MKLETINTRVLSTQHQLLSIEFTEEWLAHLREQAETKRGEDRSDRLAGECSYQPEWLEQNIWIEYLQLIHKYINQYSIKIKTHYILWFK